MHNLGWIALLRHIPPHIHQKLMLVTVSGTQVAIQGLLRIDREFVAVKGRVAGSQQAGRVFFIAYNQIDYFGFQEEIKDETFLEIFNSLVMPEPVMPAAHAGTDSKTAAATAAAVVAAAIAAASGGNVPISPTSDLPPAPQPPQAAPAREPAPAAPATGNARPIKSVVLERFRARNCGSGVRPKLASPSDHPPSGT
jgi:hypothetical protein